MSEEAADMDPVMEYVLLGDSVEDGLLAWISVGVDTTAAYSVSSAATWTSHGGVENPNSGIGGGFPPGGVPSGSPQVVSELEGVELFWLLVKCILFYRI